MATEITDMIRLSLETSLESSLKSLAREAEVVMLLIDTSGSMNEVVGRRSRFEDHGGKRRIDALREVVHNITTTGSVPTIAFGGPFDAQVRFVDGVPEPAGGTPLHAAIPFAKQYGANRLVVISDGMPDLADESLIQAKAFGGQIDVVFIGNPGEEGSFFLDRLAEATGGKRFEGDLGDTKKLTGVVIGLLDGEVEAPKAPIQGPGFTAADEPDPVLDQPLDDDDEDDDEDGDDE